MPSMSSPTPAPPGAASRAIPRRCLGLGLRLLLLVACVASQSEAQALLPPEEVEALKGIAAKLNKTDWDFSVDPCNGSAGWVSVSGPLMSNLTCDCSFNNSTVCHVISLQLMRQNLTGVLPEEAVNLTYLNDLDLSRNYIQGQIPPSWATLPVFNLSLQGNRISGKIPKELVLMPRLKSLQLEGNQLEGPIPLELGNLISLERIFISANNITGELPATFARLTNLTDFRIDGNGITGRIPDFIQNWRSVNRIDMQGTSMCGPIPSEITSLRNLTELRVTDVCGPATDFPPLQNARNLTELVLRNCSITGEVPSYIWQMPNLKVLDLSFNQLTGEIPENINLPALQYLYLTDNMFTGSIPSWMLRNKASNKVNMDISYNNFSGNPPNECQQANVNMVASFSSSHDKTIQPCLRKNFPCASNAQYSSLFINCGGKKVVVDGNEYEDDSTQIGTSTFYLSDSRVWAYSSTGDFVGNEDADYIARNTSRLKMHDLKVYTEARLSPLSLKYYGLCLENGVYSVTLHFAEIVFTSDRTFYSNGKRLFDVIIQGTKVLKDFNIEKEAGGAGLAITRNFTILVTHNTLEIHFYWAGKGTTAIPVRGVYGPLISAISVKQVSGVPRGISGGLLAVIIITCSSLLVVLFCCIKLARLRRSRNIWYLFRQNKYDISILQSRAHYLFSLKEIEVATNHFNASYKIGEGGFGPVYKGVLADGTTIAVKQLSAMSNQGNREFINEVGIISALKHENLVRLFGCCIDGNQLILIYEYMDNNSLARALFGRPEYQLKLDWPTRYNVALGMAKGLAYLHEESMLKIVHRDIKASNILLDKNFKPKISDFGLAKLNDGRDHMSTRIAGTVGYMAPEYATRGCLTHKADIYSFGVVLLELVSGVSSTDSSQNDEYLHVLDRAEELAQQGRLLELADQQLASSYSEDELLRVLKVALLCTNTSPALRPKMSMVVGMLAGQNPIEVMPDQEFREPRRIRCMVSSQNNSQTEFSYNCVSDALSQAMSAEHGEESGYLPSSSSASLR